MRSSSLLVGLLLISPVVYAQHAPAAATPAPSAHTTPASSPSTPSSSSSSGPSHSVSPSPSSSSSSTVSSSSSSHSGGGGLGPSSSHSSSSPGMDSGPSNRHERERDSSRDSSSGGGHNSGSAAGSSNSGTAHGGDSSAKDLPDLPMMRDSWGSPRDSAHEKKTDTSTSGRRDLDQDRNRRGQGQVNTPQVNAPRVNAPKIDPKIADLHDAELHDRDAATDRAIAPASGGRPQIDRDPDHRPDAVGKGQKKCDKEPCASPAPQLSQSDWRLGRCQEGPCKPCPAGTSPTKYGNCVGNARPAATAPAPPCPGGKVWNGGSCIDEFATSRASAAQCINYSSEGNRISIDLASAKQRERDECLKDSSSAECGFAQMAVMRVRSSCSSLKAPVECQSAIPSCL
jgi:hypothetical protein